MSKGIPILTLTAVLVVAGSCMAQQNSQGTQTSATPQNTQAIAGPGQQQAPNAPVLKVKTRMVVIDVVARDSKGAPITDLKQEDLTLLEDGKPQSIRIFNFQHPEPAPAGQQQPPANPPNVVDNLPHFQSGRALNIILMDSLNTSRMNQAFMREAMVKFLEKLPDNEPIAVYFLADKLRLVQDFTTDSAVLKQVVRSFKGKNSPFLTATDASSAPILPGIAQSLPPAMAAQIREFQDQMTGDFADLRVQMTLAALNSLARSLSGYPGRKNLIWVSEAFPFDVLLANASGNAFMNNRNYGNEIAHTGNLLSDYQIAIYPLDAKGLASSGFFDVANNPSNSLPAYTVRGGIGAQMDRESDDRMASHSTMNDLADRTGGRAFYNRNDLEAAVRESIDDGSTYYTLGYYPENKDWNGAFRKIQIKSQRGGVKLRYRIGYFAADSAAFAKLNPKKQDADFDEALGLNLPISTALPFKAMVMPPSEKTQNKLIVSYGVDPHALSFTEVEGGLRKVNMECAVRVFTKKSPDKPVAVEAEKMGGSLNSEAYEKVMKGFFPCRTQLSLASGDYILRLGVRDNESGLIGTTNATLTVPAESAAGPAAGASKP
ncbi:MAG TPA: VWA domain-containing protein [Candidatus Angelobacter sp.]